MNCPDCGHADAHYFSIGVGDDKLGCQHEGCTCFNFRMKAGWYRHLTGAFKPDEERTDSKV